ncbi:MAG: hypothetical protein J1E63_00260, partial [Muribaculaceae bacterium]|nr:hypothetical protein [Muribaculaceae bacterium]
LYVRKSKKLYTKYDKDIRIAVLFFTKIYLCRKSHNLFTQKCRKSHNLGVKTPLLPKISQSFCPKMPKIS